MLERDLAEARRRESDYRTRLARHRELSAKLRSHAALLREALRGPAPRAGAIERLLVDVARLSSHALGIPRASIWIFDHTRENMVCRFQLLDGKDAQTGGLSLATATCPLYVRALTNSETGRLRQVLINLVANAVDATRGHDPRFVCPPIS